VLEVLYGPSVRDRSRRGEDDLWGKEEEMTFGVIAEWALFAVVFGFMFANTVRGLVLYTKRLRVMPEDDDQRKFVTTMIRSKIIMIVMLILGCVLTAKALLESQM